MNEVPQTIIDQALISSSGVMVHNALVDERFDRSKSVMMRGVQSVMAVPLRARQRTFGVLYVDSVSHSAAFGPDDLSLLDSLGAQASLLLDNAELIVKVQQEAENRINLSRFLSAAAVDEVLSGRGSVKLDGAAAEVTVLFADIRGFTTLSSEMRPEEVVRFLNKFFEEMVEAVLNNKGTIDKFIGDCVMALWGAPEPHPAEDARNAMTAALSMVQRAKKVIVNGAPIEMGVGINTGEAVIGCIGSRQRLEYTAIGNTVNLAARLCGIAKPNEVLVTADALLPAARGSLRGCKRAGSGEGHRHPDRSVHASQPGPAARHADSAAPAGDPARQPEPESSGAKVAGIPFSQSGAQRSRRASYGQVERAAGVLEATAHASPHSHRNRRHPQGAEGVRRAERRDRARLQRRPSEAGRAG